MPTVIEELLKRASANRDISEAFKGLKPGEWQRTSEWDGRYNCIAHAAKDHKRKWWPLPIDHARKDRYWPEGAPRRVTVPAFINAFQIEEGYEPCDSAELEEGFEKVAIFITETGTSEVPKGGPTHMARQLPCGKWTSKLGNEWDICHDNLQSVEGEQYGKLNQVLCRRKRTLPIVSATQ